MVFSRFLHFGEGLARLAALGAGYATLALSFLVAFEVVARKVFNYSMQGADEIGGYVMAIGVAFSFTYALVERAHTRVDVFYAQCPVFLRAPLNLFASLSLAGMAVFMFHRGVATLQESIEFKSLASTPLQTPLWIPQGLWVVGLGLFALFTAVLALRAIYLVVTRQFGSVNKEFGPRDADDEIEEAQRELVAQFERPQA
ncbi:MAG TPA: TRAP transporter small permease [Gammaproteobacteria bacterium]|nr:TRAP transporter small permease [Gammaproteobacteria bacterium]